MGLFGPSKNEIWQALSEEIQATYDAGSFWTGSRVEARHNNWTITLDTYTQSGGNNSVTYTRMRAPFVNAGGFKFKIHKQGFFSGIGKALGGQDIEVGYPEFDGVYVIKGNDEDRVCQLFMNEKVRMLITSLTRIYMEIRPNEGMLGPKFAEDESELYFLISGVMKDLEQLKTLFELFSEVLDSMVNSGVALNVAPKVRLFKDSEAEDIQE